MLIAPEDQIWQELAEYARWAPSPHNTQPARLRINDPRNAELCFVRDRGLPVADPEGRFTYVAFGIFVEILAIAARPKGFDIQLELVPGSLYRGSESGGCVKVADLRLVDRAGAPQMIDPELVQQRRTDRNPYNRRAIPVEIVEELKQEAAGFGHSFDVATDPGTIRWVKELNRDVLFHDLEHPEFRQELASWLRFSDREAIDRRDGLSARALVLPGWLLSAFFRHHRWFTLPGIRALARKTYIATMKGISTVGWVQGDLATPEDWIRAGRLMIRMWLILTRHGVAWQPYGSVITNDDARRAMVDNLGILEGEGGRRMVWLLVRLGYSDAETVRSERLPLEEVLV